MEETNPSTTDLTEDVFSALFPNRTWLTAYEVSRALNEATGRKTPPQMMYNYIRQGLLTFEIVEGKKRVHIDEAILFVRKRVNK